MALHPAENLILFGLFWKKFPFPISPNSEIGWIFVRANLFGEVPTRAVLLGGTRPNHGRLHGKREKIPGIARPTEAGEQILIRGFPGGQAVPPHPPRNPLNLYTGDRNRASTTSPGKGRTCYTHPPRAELLSKPVEIQQNLKLYLHRSLLECPRPRMIWLHC